MTAHPLDRAVWSALSGRQSRLSLANARARRFPPAFGVFAAVQDRSDASLAALGELVGTFGDVALLEPDPPREVAGTRIVSDEAGVQMSAERLIEARGAGRGRESFRIEPLRDSDGPEMLSLATLTQPGPFFERTHQLGTFFGVRTPDGRLVAMAGERLKPRGFTEVSGVCTHPDFRGRGYGAALMRRVAGAILERGERPFLHAYADNAAAIALYGTLGFTLRAEVSFLRLARA